MNIDAAPIDRQRGYDTHSTVMVLHVPKLTKAKKKRLRLRQAAPV